MLDSVIRLRRQWAIETGILERLYTLSEGATKTLIEKGLDAALITHEDTSDPEYVFNVITDQYSAIEGLYQFIGEGRPLSKSYIKELHQVLLAHQDTYDAIDTLGTRVQRKLDRGAWKSLPNNVENTDGSKFEFCPPEHVELEMERLLSLHGEHERTEVPPDIEAAWLHHRFTLIHPFTDGNGRVARCLATLVLLKAHWFPLVLTRDDRPAYIDALRSADGGDLGSLVALFGKLQAKAIRHALSLSEEAIRGHTVIHGILGAVKAKYARIREEQNQRKNQALLIGDALQTMAYQRLREAAREVDEAIGSEGEGFRAFAYGSPRNAAKAHYHRFQIIRCANKLDYYANLHVYQGWAALAIETESRTEILLSFHGMGQGATGVLACAPMIYTKQPSEDDERAIGEVTPLMEEPFSFTYEEAPDEVEHRFQKWMEDSLIAGLAHWQRNL